MILTWAHRDRPTQADQVLDWLDGTIGPEPGVHYALQVFNAADTLLAQKLDIAGGTATVQTVVVGTLKFKLWSIRDGIASWQIVEWSLVNVAADAVAGTVITAVTWVPIDPVPSETSTRITAEGDFRITSDGSLRECR